MLIVSDFQCIVIYSKIMSTSKKKWKTKKMIQDSTRQIGKSKYNNRLGKLKFVQCTTRPGTTDSTKTKLREAVSPIDIRSGATPHEPKSLTAALPSSARINYKGSSSRPPSREPGRPYGRARWAYCRRWRWRESGWCRRAVSAGSSDQPGGQEKINTILNGVHLRKPTSKEV